MLTARRSHVLYGKLRGRAELGLDSTLEFSGGAVLGLNIDARKAIVDRNSGSLILREVIIGMGLADIEDFPEIAFRVIGIGSRDSEGLSIHVMDALAQGGGWGRPGPIPPHRPCAAAK